MTELDVFPVSLTSDIFIDILKCGYNGIVHLVNFETEAGSSKGNNYSSEITRLKVKFIRGDKECSMNFILKDVVKVTSDFITAIQGTEKEYLWYKEIYPDVLKMGLNFGAFCYRRHRDWLLLEDLCSYGYEVADRMALLDKDHCFEAVKSLAQFHAVTHHLYETSNLPEIACLETQFVPDNERFIYHNFRSLDKIADNLIEYGNEKYDSYLRNLKPNAWERMLYCLNKDYGFKCLIHGDFWITNILFKYNKQNKVEDAKIIDYQMIRIGNPFYDLHFFICTSMHPQVRDYNLNDVLTVYLESLNSTLRRIGSKDHLSEQRFQQILDDTQFMGLFITLTYLPVTLNNPDTPLIFKPPPDATLEEKQLYSPFAKVYKQNVFRNNLLSLLEFYKKKNIT